MTRVQLDSRAAEFVAQKLVSGHSIGRAVAEHSARLKNRWTIAPEHSDDVSLYRFDAGGLLAGSPRSGSISPIPNTDDHLTQFLSELLNSSPTKACLIEDFNARTHDQFLAKTSGLLIYGVEVSHLLRGPTDNEKIAAKIRETRSIPHFVGFIGDYDLSMPKQFDRIEISLDDVNRIAAKTTAVFVGAYDGESYVIAES